MQIILCVSNKSLMKPRSSWFAILSLVNRLLVHVLLQHKTIESVLQRGEKLDNLVERSTALSAQSKMFYKTAKKVYLSLFFLSSMADLASL